MVTFGIFPGDWLLIHNKILYIYNTYIQDYRGREDSWSQTSLKVKSQAW